MPPRRKAGQSSSGPPRQIYTGEESFLNFIHPLEEYSGSIWKESSSLQVAMMYCINSMGGSASEECILDFIKKKWDIINKYSRRGVLIEPSIRVVRLNCTIKRKGRHLFIENPNKPHEWMLNTKLRKNSKYQPIQNDHEDSLPEYIEKNENNSEKNESKNDEELEYRPIFDENVYEYIHEIGHPVEFIKISESMHSHSNDPGNFSRLPFLRRLRAVLMSLKCQGRINYDPLNNLWSDNA